MAIKRNQLKLMEYIGSVRNSVIFKPILYSVVLSMVVSLDEGSRMVPLLIGFQTTWISKNLVMLNTILIRVTGTKYLKTRRLRARESFIVWKEKYLFKLGNFLLCHKTNVWSLWSFFPVHSQGKDEFPFMWIRACFLCSWEMFLKFKFKGFSNAVCWHCNSTSSSETMPTFVFNGFSALEIEVF